MTNSPLVTPRLLPLGDAAWSVEFGDSIDPSLHARVMGFAQSLKNLQAENALPGVSEWVPSFRSLTVYFDPLQTDAEQLAATLLRVAGDSTEVVAHGRRWRIPVCFGGAGGPDLDDLARASGLDTDAMIARMTSTVFHVYMLGFMPGFPYMGGLPPEFSLPRLATPRKSVAARSLAVTGNLCAIYPWESPGGWRLLGRTPVNLFDAADSRRPALFAPGDTAMWQAIDAETFHSMEAEAARGQLDRAQFLVAEGSPWPVR
ncbi:MAG: 5-oxoprolinase subunit PxpB [Betaproteobacteria bacterium]|nr:5-oxoprolinase subunit PxpB [Betaproteobacteria bacterium]